MISVLNAAVPHTHTHAAIWPHVNCLIYTHFGNLLNCISIKWAFMAT